MIPVATISGKRLLPEHEYRRYQSGAKRVWAVDNSDPQCSILLATCRIVGLWPQPRSAIEKARRKHNPGAYNWYKQPTETE